MHETRKLHVCVLSKDEALGDFRFVLKKLNPNSYTELSFLSFSVVILLPSLTPFPGFTVSPRDSSCRVCCCELFFYGN